MNLLFDLDGTLTDSSEGIVRSLIYTLERLDRPIPDRLQALNQGESKSELRHYIGPPIRQVFTELLESQDSDAIEAAIVIFRERFIPIGIYENHVYPGIVELLDGLKSQHKLFVATSKPQVLAQIVLDHFGLAPYFSAIYGTGLDGHLDRKPLLVQKLLADQNLDSTKTWMIGDRYHDIEAALFNQLGSIGVTYGYGGKAELEAAGAIKICDNPREIEATIGAITKQLD
jgi:phosphoglycolate phosphatase